MHDMRHLMSLYLTGDDLYISLHYTTISDALRNFSDLSKFDIYF